MTTALLLAGPPHGPALWDAVQARLAATMPCEALALLVEPGVEATVEGQVQWLLRRLGDAGPRPVLVAHGLALPVAIRAAARHPGVRLVVGNGPVRRLDPVTTGLCGLSHVPGLLAQGLFQPALVLRWLYSSAGLRRAVRNPYVMDRDTVVAVCGPLFESAERRRAVVRYLRDLPEAVRSTPTHDGPCLAVWGDEDALYPPADVDEARLVLPRLEHVDIPGGRQLHPVERPWAVADAIAEWANRS